MDSQLEGNKMSIFQISEKVIDYSLEHNAGLDESLDQFELTDDERAAVIAELGV